MTTIDLPFVLDAVANHLYGASQEKLRGQLEKESGLTITGDDVFHLIFACGTILEEEGRIMMKSLTLPTEHFVIQEALSVAISCGRPVVKQLVEVAKMLRTRASEDDAYVGVLRAALFALLDGTDVRR